MPDARLQRTRATLPAGYRFGDGARANFVYDAKLGISLRFIRQFNPAHPREPTQADADLVRYLRNWRAPHENDAEQLKRQSRFASADQVSDTDVTPMSGQLFSLEGPPVSDGATFQNVASILAEQLRGQLHAQGFTRFQCYELRETPGIEWVAQIDGIRVIATYDMTMTGMRSRADTIAMK